MNHPFVPRATAFTFAALLTLGVFAGIDHLAGIENAGAVLDASSTPVQQVVIVAPRLPA
jgi:hypothetical protein